MYLVDTNIFLEIFLKQEKSETCKFFLTKNIGLINISDSTLHSIGVILFKQKKEQEFLDFISDTLPKTSLLSLPKNNYDEIAVIKTKFNLDFDDSYQFMICKYFNLKLITMDQDFKNIQDIEVKFI